MGGRGRMTRVGSGRATTVGGTSATETAGMTAHAQAWSTGPRLLPRRLVVLLAILARLGLVADAGAAG
jgi:hypothetical protein